MSTNRFQESNKELAKAPTIEAAIGQFFVESPNLKISWSNGSIEGGSESLARALFNAHLTSTDSGTPISLTAEGIKILRKAAFDPRQLTGDSHQTTYEFQEIIGSGRESVVFLAHHRLVKRRVAIKVFYGTGSLFRYENIYERFESAKLRKADPFVLPIDFLHLKLHDYWGRDAEFEAVVFPYETAVELSHFLQRARPLTPFIVREYITQVGGGLSKIHQAGISHSDIHLSNILVEEGPDGLLSFLIIDFTGNSPGSTNEGLSSDWKGFVAGLVLILAKMPLHRMSLQRHIGAKTYTLIEAILEKRISSTLDLEQARRDSRFYLQYRRDSESFIERKFKAGNTLGLVRHEEITSPEIARELFVPFEPFFQQFSEFGAAILNGHRGSGKSSFVAALATLPHSKVTFVDPRAKFGILFPCRQGEFKQLRSVESSKRGPDYYRSLKHLLILKIFRRTLAILLEAQSSAVFLLDQDFRIDPIAEYFKRNLPIEANATFQSSVQERLESLSESTVRYELETTDRLFSNNFDLPTTKFLNEISLIEFFESIRQSSGVLAQTQFYLLFDDAGTPNMPTCMQHVLNELLRSANKIFCVKVTAERFSYAESDSDGKALEAPHDFRPFNLAETFFLRGGQQVARREIKDYFYSVVQKRLLNYRSNSVTDYLGENFSTMTAFIRKLARSPRAKGVYAGWEIVWQVADRTPRHLLEMLSNIFDKAGVSPESNVGVIPAELQDRVVRTYSEEKLRHLSYLPGRLSIRDQILPLGQHLHDIAVAFGRISRKKLEAGRMITSGNERERYYECLAIEIDKQKRLGKQATHILESLVRYAVFDDSKIGITRDGGIKQPIYVFNRIYAPAFGISIRREVHWTIRASRLETFLLDPGSELKRAIISDSDTDSVGDLFDYE